MRSRPNRYGHRVSFFSRVLVAVSVAGITLVSAPPVSGEPAPEPRPGEVVHVAGLDKWSGYSGDGGAATQARLGGEVDIAVAAAGTMYIADTYNEAIRVVTVDGVITTLPVVVPPETWFLPSAVALDKAGVLYIATNTTVQRLNPDGTTTVVAGGGEKSFDYPDNGGDGGDGGPATDVSLGGVDDLAIGPDGSLYLAESVFDRVRRVAPDGTISTVAGGGVGGSVLDTPSHVAADPTGTVYFVHSGFRGVQKIAPDGSISPVLGQREEPGFSGDGGPAAEAGFEYVEGIATDADGNLYVADVGNQVVRMIDPQGVIDTVGPAVWGVDDVTVGPNADLYVTAEGQIKRLVRGTAEVAGGEEVRPGPARWADQDPGTVLPVVGAGREMTDEERWGGGNGAMAAGPDGTVYYVGGNDQVVVLRPDGTREVYAGSGMGYSGDGGPAAEAELYNPLALAVDKDGNLYIADSYNFRIRKVDSSGTITTIAGSGEDLSILDEEPNGDGGPATEARIMPLDLAPGPDGSLYVVDQYANGRIRKIDPQGIITTLAGGGERRGDDARTAAEFTFGGSTPWSLAVDQGGNVYFSTADRVYRVGPGGELSAVTGEGAGFAGDGGPAAQALVNSPQGLAVGPDGTLYIADSRNNLVRAVRPDGTMTTVAGNGVLEDSGDGGAATDAGLHEPELVATDGDGNLSVTTDRTARIRKIDTDGTISTATELGLVVDGVAADEVVVDQPAAVAVDTAGTVFVAGEASIIAATADDKARPVADTQYVTSLATGPDGSVYVPHDGMVDRVHPDGATVTVAGVGVRWTSDEPLPDVDGKRATTSVLDTGDVAVSPAGELYLTSGSRVYRVDRDGMLRFVVDLKDAEGSSDAEEVWLAIAVTRDGEILLADSTSHRVFAANNEGEIRTFAGNGENVYGDDREDGAQATDAPVSSPDDLAVAPDGTVYIATSNGIRRVSTDGEIDTVAENEDGESPTAVALDANGNLYFTTPERHQVFVVVRPGELAQPFPWSVLWWALVAVALGAVVFRVVHLRRRIARAEAQPEPAPAE
jgi:sugar lactone lactonase YvrE